MHGLRPIAEIQFADFIHPAFDQIVNEAAKIRYRSNGAFGVPMVIRAPFGGGRPRRAVPLAESIEAFFTHVPGLKVVVPSTPDDAKGLLKAAIRDPRPGAVLRAQEDATGSSRARCPTATTIVPLGKADVAREGTRHHDLSLRR